MSLESKHVLVFAATGAIGSGVARELAGQGAQVWLSGRRADALRDLAGELSGAGGKVATDVVDATDPQQVADYVERVAAQTGGRIDGVFNAIGLPPAELGYPARSPELDFDMFMKPQRIILGSTFLTARCAGAHMLGQGSGSIVTLSASLSGTTIPWMAALTATCGAIEAMTRSLSAEFAPAGVRVNCVRGDAMPETTTIRETSARSAAIAGVDPADFQLPPGPLGRGITVAETAATVAFLLSDAASGMTSQVLNVSDNTLV